MDWAFVAAAAVVAAAASLIGTNVVLRRLERRAVLDHPGERSSHTQPTPHGGGIAVVAVVVAGWSALSLRLPEVSSDALVVVAACVPLAVVSRLDDLRGLSPAWRLLAQAAVIGAVLALAEPAGPYFGGLLPPGLDAAAAFVLWLWFVNLFNFMDGIDGIAATETACIGLGLVLVAGLAGGAGAAHAAVLAGAALGFLWWNRPPARLFLGDVGSVPLGFLLGWLLLDAAARGLWAPALILPLYYLADATLTLLRRLARREKVWRAHREHYYQRALRRGLSQAAVVGAVLLANLALVGLAAAAAGGWPWTALGAAAAVVAGLLVHLGGPRLRRGAAE